MKLKILFLVLILCINSLFAFEEQNIKIKMANTIDKILLIVKDSKMSKDFKSKEIIILMQSILDYKLMSKLALGKKWKSIDKDEQILFNKYFKKILENSYVDKLSLYTDELVKINNLEKVKKNRIKLFTQLIGKDSKYDIIYKFYKKSKTKDWFIYDIDLMGVSVIKTYRKQFASFLKDKNFQDLLETLKNK